MAITSMYDNNDISMCNFFCLKKARYFYDALIGFCSSIVRVNYIISFCYENDTSNR